MFNKIVIIKNDDGSCGILRPAPDMFDENSKTRSLLPELKGKSNEEIFQFIIDKDVPKGKSYRVAERDAIPTDREFRDAWTDDNQTPTVDIDIPKALEIKKDQLRGLRQPLLEALDVAFMRALELGADTSLIVEKKQALRDVTDLPPLLTIDEIKEHFPEVLR